MRLNCFRRRKSAVCLSVPREPSFQRQQKRYEPGRGNCRKKGAPIVAPGGPRSRETGSGYETKSELADREVDSAEGSAQPQHRHVGLGSLLYAKKPLGKQQRSLRLIAIAHKAW